MFLLLADDEVADEVTGIVGTDERAFLIAYAWHVVRLDLADVLAFLSRLQRPPVCWFIVDEPIGGRQPLRQSRTNQGQEGMNNGLNGLKRIFHLINFWRYE